MDILIKYNKNTRAFSIFEKGSDFSVEIGDTFVTDDEDFVYLTVQPQEEENGDENFDTIG